MPATNSQVAISPDIIQMTILGNECAMNPATKPSRATKLDSLIRRKSTIQVWYGAGSIVLVHTQCYDFLNQPESRQYNGFTSVGHLYPNSGRKPKNAASRGMPRPFSTSELIPDLGGPDGNTITPAGRPPAAGPARPTCSAAIRPSRSADPDPAPSRGRRSLGCGLPGWSSNHPAGCGVRHPPEYCSEAAKGARCAPSTRPAQMRQQIRD